MNGGIVRNAEGELCADGVALSEIAGQFGTPCYVYSAAVLQQNIAAWQGALQQWKDRSQLCYSVKANSNLSLLRLLADAGWGFDIVSGGELARLMHLGVPAERVRFSGVGKTANELQQAVRCGIGAVHLESAGEAELLARIAAEEGRNASAPVAVSLRVNPGIRAGGNENISTAFQGAKFGLSIAAWQQFAPRLAALPQLRLTGLACHLGSQIDSIEPYLAAARTLADWAQQLNADAAVAANIADIDLGGGVAVADPTSSVQADAGLASAHVAPPPLQPSALAAAVVPQIVNAGFRCVFSPGRSVIATAGVLLMQVLYLKTAAEDGGSRCHAIVDAAMNDYARTALYGAVPVLESVAPQRGTVGHCDIAGPVCETTDTFVRDFPIRPEAGSLLAMRDTGAYGMSMSSSYNSRLRACEVLVDGGQCRLIRRREELADLFAHETELGC